MRVADYKELRVYKLRTKEALDFYMEKIYPRHLNSFPPIHDPAAFPFMWITGIRDIFAGLVILPFLWRGDRRTTATLFAISISSRSAMGLSFCDILALRRFAPKASNEASRRSPIASRPIREAMTSGRCRLVPTRRRARSLGRRRTSSTCCSRHGGSACR